MKHQSDVLTLFLELASIPSPPGSEREVADRVGGYLRDLALDADEDDAGRRIGSNAGNMLCRIPPSSNDGGTAIFLCAHLDTVPPEADRAGHRGRRRPERRRDDPRRRQQGGGRGDARGRPARPGREPPARRHRAPVHAARGGRAARRLRVRPHAPARVRSGSSSTRARRSATSSSARRRRRRCRRASTAGRRTPGWPPRRGARRSRPRRVRSRT